MLALVPIAAVLWPFEYSVVHRVVEDAVDPAERQGLGVTVLPTGNVIQKAWVGWED